MTTLRNMVEEAAKVADAAERAAEREAAREKKRGNQGAYAMAIVARDISRGIAFEIRKLAAAEPEANQCDGCRAGKPRDARGNHVMGETSGYEDPMRCQRDRYAAAEPEAKDGYPMGAGEVDRLALLGGDYPEAKADSCKRCGGTGDVGDQDDQECPACNGTGKPPCKRCSGLGEITMGKHGKTLPCVDCGGAG